jgi:fatty acid desaturase
MENRMLDKQLLDFKHAEIVGDKNIPYLEFRKNLKPIYWRVWIDIFYAYFFIFLVLVLCSLLSNLSILIQFVFTLLAALITGYTFAFLNLFLHEASHFGLAKNRNLNDFLGWMTVGWIVGTNVSRYRPTHSKHHTFLGEIQDPENSYFTSVNIFSIAKGLFGIQAIKKILNVKSPNQVLDKPKFYLHPLFFGLAVHIIITSNLILLRNWYGLAAWILGIFLFFPFFAWIRQILEHRSDLATSRINYFEVPHGAISRIFGDDLISYTLGGAGFNKHIIHHWDPAISYTRLREVEKFLLRSNASEAIQSSRTTYWATFMTLLGQE